jgi:hypothetical protein
MTCSCHAVAVFGHRADCGHGRAFIQLDPHALPVTLVPPGALAAAMDARQAQWDRPLTEERP